MIGNGFGWTEPVLEDLQTIRLQDALLEERDGKVSQTVWPQADYIIGNPPFLGSQFLRRELGDRYVEQLFAAYDDTIPSGSDLCCYFFEKARQEIADNRTQRAGLLATNSIRGGANREVLKRIKDSGDIFMAWSDEPWILAGAAVRISIVGFDDCYEQDKSLNGLPVTSVNSDLTGGIDITAAAKLSENDLLSFKGDEKGGSFEISQDVAKHLIQQPINVNGRSNSDVVKPWMNGLDIVRRPRNLWIIDFGVDTPIEEAAKYEAPFQHVKDHVFDERQNNRNPRLAERWWLHRSPAIPMREKTNTLSRFLGTARVAKHRVYIWLKPGTLPDSQIVVFAREDD
jgi:type II restriction/modification system DNA methylase subunit YeeA